MKVQEVYQRYLLKINKNDTNSNINVNKGLFILIYNEQSKIWLKNKIKEYLKNSEKNYLSSLIVFEKELEKIKNYNKYTEFLLPIDFFDLEYCYSIASTECCKNRQLLNWDFKTRNRNNIYQDENNKPSFEYEETLYNISDNKLLVFKDNFEIDKEIITYYKYPKEIDIQGYEKFDGSQSVNIDPDIEDIYVNEIINMCALETVTNFENFETYQLQQQRIINNKQ